MKKWVEDEDERCPYCGKPLEFLTDGKYDYAERCSHCQKWHKTYKVMEGDLGDDDCSA